MGWTLPPRGLTTSRFSVVKARTLLECAAFPRASAPLQSLTRRPVAPVLADAGTLTRFLAPTALPTRRGPPLPDLSLVPGHVAPSHLPCASAPCSLGGLPGVLSTRCAHGTKPSELHQSEISRCLPSNASPLAIGDRPLQQTQGLLFRTSRDWPPKGLVPRTDHRRPVPLVSAVLLALSAHRHFCQSGLASGVCSLCRLGPPPPDFSTRGTPCSLGFHPPWGTPLLRLDLDGCRDSFSRSTTPPHSQDRSCEHAWSPLGTSGHPRSEMCSLCSRVSKSCGRWRCLFRGCRPLEVCVLIPPWRGFVVCECLDVHRKMLSKPRSRCETWLLTTRRDTA
jgi:hypothetical protein